MARKLPTFLKPDEPEKLLAAADTERDRLIGILMLCMGLRVSEVCKLQVEHVDFPRKTIWVRNGKGDKDRAIPLPAFLVGPLRAWVRGRITGYFFESPRGGRLTTRAVQLLIKRLARRAKLPEPDKHRKYHPHALRHIFATRLLESGATIYEVKELLGHSNIAVTEKYLHSTPEKLRVAMDRLYG